MYALLSGLYIRTNHEGCVCVVGAEGGGGRGVGQAKEGKKCVFKET